MNYPFAVVFIMDEKMLPGLHVSLSTLLKNLNVNDEDIHIYVYCDRFTIKHKHKHKELINKTFNLFNRTDKCKLFIKDFDILYDKKNLNPLHGSLATYGRLFIDKLLPDYDRCLYLDSDLLINCSVIDLFNNFDDKHILFVDGNGIRKSTLDKNIYIKNNIDINGKCFNAGVLGINLKLWRDNNIYTKCIHFAEVQKNDIKTVDETILNVICHDTFKPMGNKWNYHLYPSNKSPLKLESKIYHFVGSPKPWDIFGNILNNHYSFWRKEYCKTAIGDVFYLNYFSFSRSFFISKQIIRAIKMKLFGKKQNGKHSKT